MKITLCPDDHIIQTNLTVDGKLINDIATYVYTHKMCGQYSPESEPEHRLIQMFLKSLVGKLDGLKGSIA